MGQLDRQHGHAIPGAISSSSVLAKMQRGLHASAPKEGCWEGDLTGRLRLQPGEACKTVAHSPSARVAVVWPRQNKVMEGTGSKGSA